MVPGRFCRLLSSHRAAFCSAPRAARGAPSAPAAPAESPVSALSHATAAAGQGDKVIVVQGSSRGLGLAFVSHLLAESSSGENPARERHSSRIVGSVI